VPHHPRIRGATIIKEPPQKTGIVKQLTDDLFDRTMMVIEAVVLILIAYDVAYERTHHWKIRRRSRRVHQCFVAGQTIKKIPPPTNADADTIKAWLGTLDKWYDSTEALPRKYSIQAEATFLHSHPTDAMSRTFLHVARDKEVQWQYLNLYERLDNLQKVIESPDVYL
jgi:hypothetical protein